ncbi:hypothetical protein ASPZODRAFT_12150 [Penicilliopsis zonata CBS 506.65]|uniref:ER lumen protein-retaining receptor n=1 Tax=Penicilliopsis zonata CBS 506.65 TaxID=1073090 RepID=A0A1L9SW00_9EURO|nr:hypothetical protein ASPZODRAFT_12150 [Penicilliopsis zonata CBS 506.65]OJJ51314.1 hypothetical protein ASPZODRAFT_12150 [Penicilliopsis zonata CBS 506.65]
MNIFRILGDLAHISSKCILILAIHRNKSAEGVSLLTQLLYALVFLNRYIELFLFRWHDSTWNIFFKIFYILSSIYIIALMMKVYPRTREREKAWKLAIWSVGGSIVLAPIVLWIFSSEYPRHWFTEVSDFIGILPQNSRNGSLNEWGKLLQTTWSFSIILESVCVLPQLLLLRQTTVPTVIDSYYLVTLGSYRALYILNWLVRGFGPEHFWDPVADIFGVVQTAFYVDFAWVYYSRQRVKLRNGGIVDSEDLRNSWLVNKVFSFRARRSTDEEEQLHTDHQGDEADSHSRNNRWGARGVSIAADDTLTDHDRNKAAPRNDTLQDIFEDEDSGSDEPGHSIVAGP